MRPIKQLAAHWYYNASASIARARHCFDTQRVFIRLLYGQAEDIVGQRTILLHAMDTYE